MSIETDNEFLLGLPSIGPDSSSQDLYSVWNEIKDVRNQNPLFQSPYHVYQNEYDKLKFGLRLNLVTPVEANAAIGRLATYSDPREIRFVAEYWFKLGSQVEGLNLNQVKQVWQSGIDCLESPFQKASEQASFFETTAPVTGLTADQRATLENSAESVRSALPDQKHFSDFESDNLSHLLDFIPTAEKLGLNVDDLRHYLDHQLDNFDILASGRHLIAHMVSYIEMSRLDRETKLTKILSFINQVENIQDEGKTKSLVCEKAVSALLSIDEYQRAKQVWAKIGEEVGVSVLTSTLAEYAMTHHLADDFRREHSTYIKLSKNTDTDDSQWQESNWEMMWFFAAKDAKKAHPESTPFTDPTVSAYIAAGEADFNIDELAALATANPKDKELNDIVAHNVTALTKKFNLGRLNIVASRHLFEALLELRASALTNSPSSL
jgi:hypothetical protein